MSNVMLVIALMISTSVLSQVTKKPDVDIVVSETRLKNKMYEYNFTISNNEKDFPIGNIQIGCSYEDGRLISMAKFNPVELKKKKILYEGKVGVTTIGQYSGSVPAGWVATADYAADDASPDPKYALDIKGGIINPGETLGGFILLSPVPMPELLDIPVCLLGVRTGLEYTNVRPEFASPPSDDKNLSALIKECIDSNYKLNGLSIRRTKDKTCKKIRGDDKEIFDNLAKTCERLVVQKLRLGETFKYKADSSNYAGDKKLAKYLSDKSKDKNRVEKLIGHTQVKIAKEEKRLGEILKEQEEYIKKSEGCEFKGRK